MKKLFLVTLTLASLAHADVDYSKCLSVIGMNGFLDNDGKVSPFFKDHIKNVKTEGKVETYTIAHSGYNLGYGPSLGTDQVIKIERDDQGRVIKTSIGGDSLDTKTIKAFKNYMVQGSVMSGAAPYSGGFGQGLIGRTLLQEPHFFVKNKNGSKDWVSLSNISKSQAKELGLQGDIDHLQKLKQQWRKDKKVVAKLQEGFSSLVEKAPLVVPMGPEAEFEIKDGVCLLNNIAYRSFNPEVKQVVKTPGLSKGQCEKVRALYPKYQAKIVECSGLESTIAKDVPDLNLINGFAIGGLGGGAVGGYGPWGPTNSLANANFQCDFLYGDRPNLYPGNMPGMDKPPKSNQM